MEKKFIILIASIIVVFISIGSLFFCNLKKNKSYSTYSIALEKYNNGEYYSAQKKFQHIGRFSPLKPAAIYREALCANKLGKKEDELRNYERIKVLYPNSVVASRAVYQEAKLNYKFKKYNKALKQFKFVSKKYPKSKYALASDYYIALIDSEKYKSSPSKDREIISRCKKYLIEAPTGIYAINCVKLLEKYILSVDENLLVGKVYLANNDYKNAEKYLSKLDISSVWPYLVQIYYALKDYEKVRNFTKMGLASSTAIDTKEQRESSYKAIDLYLNTFENKKTALSSLLNIGNKNRSYDYLMYKNCQNASENSKDICYSSIYQIYPNGNFAAEALSNIFYSNIQKEDYKNAIKLGKLHLMNYKKAKSTPKVLYWLAYSYLKVNDIVNARYYYSQLMNEYPDDYYTYLAFISTNKIRNSVQSNQITPQSVEFPYPQTNDKFLKALLQVEDYGFINIFYEDDGFIKSWLLYKEGDYTTSARMARDAMAKLEEKPDKTDVRWRLVYPIHFYDEIVNNSTSATDKTLILSIIREESYFNSLAKSPVGAMGLMQLMPNSAKDIASRVSYPLLNTDLLYNPQVNIKLGIMYFSYLKGVLAGNNRLGVIAYNGGLGSVKSWSKTIQSFNFEDFVEQIPYSETQNYYKKIYKTYWNYLRIYNGLNF